MGWSVTLIRFLCTASSALLSATLPPRLPNRQIYQRIHRYRAAICFRSIVGHGTVVLWEPS